MSTNATALTAPNRFVEATNGVTYAYRRLGPPTGVPLILLQHFRGNLDNWDPALVDNLAREREVIAFDNTGVGLSTGTTPSTVGQMARDAISFVSALALSQVDLLGYSIGGFVAQEVALIRPTLVRRLVLAATAPRGAPGMHGWRQDVVEHATRDTPSIEDVLSIFFKHTPTSQGAGMEFLKRFSARTNDRDQASTLATRDAQYDAIVTWGVPNHSLLEHLSAIAQPALVARGLKRPLLWSGKGGLHAYQRIVPTPSTGPAWA
jgi:pimeloyl-ACP methyl ester carboxylesterase